MVGVVATTTAAGAATVVEAGEERRVLVVAQGAAKKATRPIFLYVMPTTPYCKSIGWGHRVCPLQVCHLSRSSESTHFLSLRRDVALFDITRAPDGF